MGTNCARRLRRISLNTRLRVIVISQVVNLAEGS